MEERKERAEGVRQQGERGMEGKGRSKPSQVIKTQEKSEKLLWCEEPKEDSDSGLRAAELHVCDGELTQQGAEHEQ